ncbi:MAG: hypothetical protein ABIJ09_04045 [Pseudomonadota bacterium]
MTMGVLESITGHLSTLLDERASFEARYGKKAVVFLEHLPALFRLFHRLTFEFALTTQARQKSASVAVYIAEHQDFVGEATRGAEGLIDDVWIAYTVLAQLLETVPDEVLRAHWRSEASFDEVTALAPNVGTLDDLVPSRVLTLARQFLGLEDPEVSAEA